MTKLVNRAKMTTATTGTGTIILGSAVDGYQTFAAAGVADADVVRYVIEDGTDWEIGTGTYSGGTLTRSASESSNAGSAISLSGDAVVYVSAVAEDIKAPFAYEAVSGATQDLDVGRYNFFDGGDITENTSISFANVPTEAKWEYSFLASPTGSYNIVDTIDDGVSFSVSGQDVSPEGLFFKDDGTKMYVVGSSSDSVHQYSLSTAWDLSTASYDNVSFSVSGQDFAPHDLFFKSDGTKMYILGAGDDSVHQYSLSTAWDVSSASYDGVSFSVSTQAGTPTFLFFKSDGTKMYAGGSSSDSVFQYSLSTAWDVSSASYDGVSFSVSGQDIFPEGLFFKDDGTKMYVAGGQNDSVIEYSLSTAWDLSTAFYDGVSSSGVGDATPRGVFFKSDGKKMYVTGAQTDSVFEFLTSGVVSLTFPSSVQNPPRRSLGFGQKVTYGFYTSDGGSTVYFIDDEVL